jgi:hypothetical protein
MNKNRIHLNLAIEEFSILDYRLLSLYYRALYPNKKKYSWPKPLEYHEIFEVFTAVTIKIGVFWDVTPFGSCKNRGFGGT